MPRLTFIEPEPTNEPVPYAPWVVLLYDPPTRAALRWAAPATLVALASVDWQPMMRTALTWWYVYALAARADMMRPASLVLT